MADDFLVEQEVKKAKEEEGREAKRLTELQALYDAKKLELKPLERKEYDGTLKITNEVNEHA